MAGGNIGTGSPPTASPTGGGAHRPPAPTTTTGGLSGPNFTNDILNHLPPPKRTEMLNLVHKFRSKQIAIQEFLSLSRNLLGEQLYAVLARGMSAAVKPPGAATSTAVGNAASAASATTSAAAGDGDDTAGGFDVNRLDTAALQDVIQYSGVDLKAEAEMILRTHEASYPLANGGGATQGAGAYAREARLHHDYYFNSAPLRALISKIVCPRGITDMGEDCLDMIALAAARRLGNIVGQLAAISRERVDAGRARFKIKIENDPRRQMWLVEQYLRAEGQRVASGQGASGTGGAGSAEALARAAKLRKAERRAGEDVAVKTKLANVTAAVATGLQLKSWMTDPAALAAVLPESSSVTAGASGTGEGDGGMSGTGGSTTAAGSSGAPTLHFGQAPSMTPTSDRELQAQFAARTITLADLIHLAEGDPHLRHSNILISLYNQQRSE